IGVFGAFMALIAFIFNVQITEGENYRNAQPDVWIYLVGDITLAFFAGLIGIGVSAYIGGQLLTKDLRNGSIRLINSYPISRKSIYTSRVLTGGLLYLPLTVLIAFIIVTYGTLLGSSKLDYKISDQLEIYFRTLITVILIVFFVGYLAAMTANFFGILFKSETQGIILSIVILAIGDIIVTILSAIVPDWHLENFSITYHRTQLFEYLLQVKGEVDQTGGFERTAIYQSADISFPFTSFFTVFIFPLFLAYLGYLKFKKMDLE
ncbi:MAG: ABC transporter permease subunit, partial [Candidatus Kariarchaeaceae archaeon]